MGGMSRVDDVNCRRMLRAYIFKDITPSLNLVNSESERTLHGSADALGIEDARRGYCEPLTSLEYGD